MEQDIPYDATIQNIQR